MKSTSIKENKLLSIVSVILYAVFAVYIFLLGLYNVAPGFVEKLKLLEDNHAFFGGITYNWFEITMAMTFRYAFVFSLGLAGCIILAVKCQIGKKKIVLVIMPVFFFVLSCFIQELKYSGHGLYKLANILTWLGLILVLLSFIFFLVMAINSRKLHWK